MNRHMSSSPTAHRLPVRPEPHFGESPRGYLLRLSLANGYPTPVWLQALEPRIWQVSDESAVLEAIERLTGLSSIKQKLQSTISTSKLSSRFSASPRICPECVMEHGFHDAIWEVAFSCACPRHGILLIDSCPICTKPLSWIRDGLALCSCGADLTAGDHVKAGKHLQYLCAKIWKAAGREVDEIKIPGFPDESLTGRSVEELCQFFWFLSSYGNGHLRMNRNRPESVAAAVAELEVVRSMLAEWPSGLHRLLNGRRNEGGRFAGEGLQQAFGKLYKDLYDNLSGEKFSFAREAFEEFIGANWDGVLDGKYKRIDQDRSRNGFISVTEAANLLGMSQERLKKFVRLGFVQGASVQRPSGRLHTMISEDEVQRFSIEMKYAVNGEETRKFLGISKKRCKVLMEEGYITPMIKAGESGINKWWVDVRRIEKFLEEIHAIVPHRVPDASTIPFTKACQMHQSGARFLPNLIDAIREGRVPVAGLKINGKFSLESLYFSRGALVDFRDGLKERRPGVYSVPEAAIVLGVKEQVAYNLVRTGLISSEPGPSAKKAGSTITEASIDLFRSTYVPLSQLANSQKTSVRKISNELGKLGIVPVTGRPVDNYRKVYYRRSDLPCDKWLAHF